MYKQYRVLCGLAKASLLLDGTILIIGFPYFVLLFINIRRGNIDNSAGPIVEAIILFTMFISVHIAYKILMIGVLYIYFSKLFKFSCCYSNFNSLLFFSSFF